MTLNFPKNIQSLVISFASKEQLKTFLSVNKHWREAALETMQQQLHNEALSIFSNFSSEGEKQFNEIFCSKPSTIDDIFEQSIRISKIALNGLIEIDDKIGRSTNVEAAASIWRQLAEPWEGEQSELKELLLQLVHMNLGRLVLEKMDLLVDDKLREECIFALIKHSAGCNRFLLKKASEYFIVRKEEKWLLFIYIYHKSELDNYLKENGCLQTLKTYSDPTLFIRKIEMSQIFAPIAARTPADEIEALIDWAAAQKSERFVYVCIIKRLLELNLYDRSVALFDEVYPTLSDKGRNSLTRDFYWAIESTKNVKWTYIFLNKIEYEKNQALFDVSSILREELFEKCLEEKRYLLADAVTHGFFKSFILQKRVFNKLLEEKDIDLIFEFLECARKPKDYIGFLPPVIYQLLEEKEFLLAAKLTNWIDFNRIYLFNQILKSVVEEKDIVLVLQFALQIKKREDRSNVYLYIANWYLDKHDYEQALEFADLIQLKKKRDQFASNFADHLAIFGELERGKELSQLISTEYTRDMVLVKIGKRKKCSSDDDLYFLNQRKYLEAIDILIENKKFSEAMRKVHTVCHYSKKGEYYKKVIKYAKKSLSEEEVWKLIMSVPPDWRYEV